MITRAKECKVELREHMRNGDGTVKITSLASAADLYQKGRMFANITLLPGCGIGYHVHEKESEFFYIIKGNAVYNDNGKETVLCAGDVSITASGEGHSIMNKSDENVEIVALIILK